MNNKGVQSRCLLIEDCDFVAWPKGGQLGFVRQLMRVFGNRFALVGTVCDDTPTGVWLKKEIDGVAYDFFAIGRRNTNPAKPLIPNRLSGYWQLRKYRQKILGKGIHSAFIQAPELLMVASQWHLDSICYCFPGVENPLLFSRYPWARILAAPFDRYFFRALDSASSVLASADERSITQLIWRSRGTLERQQVHMFPTRVDEDLFYYDENKKDNRPGGRKGSLLAVLGRINYVKGWKLIIDSFSCLLKEKPDCRLVFIGDGEDRLQLERYCRDAGVAGQVAITGFLSSLEIARQLQHVDCSLCASWIEGWSLAMLESLACGCPLVTTDVSGTRQMIVEGVNGYIVDERNPVSMVKAILNVLCKEIDRKQISLDILNRYGLKTLEPDLQKFWPGSPLMDHYGNS